MLLDKQWSIKRTMKGVTNDVIDNIYQGAKKHGALGGKIMGAGGRGFLMLYSTSKKKEVNKFMNDNGYPETPFRFDDEGSKIIFEG